MNFPSISNKIGKVWAGKTAISVFPRHNRMYFAVDVTRVAAVGFPCDKCCIPEFEELWKTLFL
jgi:hypothetical protein